MTDQLRGDAPRRLRDEDMVRQVKDHQALNFWERAFPGVELSETNAGELAGELAGKFREFEEQQSGRIDIDFIYAIDHARKMAEAREYGRMNPESFERENKTWKLRNQIGEKALQMQSGQIPPPVASE